MDPDAVSAIADKLDHTAQRVDGVVNAVNSITSSLGQLWFGDDLHAFNGAWASQHRPAVSHVAQEVARWTAELRHQVRQQLEASGMAQRAGDQPGSVLIWLKALRDLYSGISKWVIGSTKFGASIIRAIYGRFAPRDALGRFVRIDSLSRLERSKALSKAENWVAKPGNSQILARWSKVGKFLGKVGKVSPWVSFGFSGLDEWNRQKSQPVPQRVADGVVVGAFTALGGLLGAAAGGLVGVPSGPGAVATGIAGGVGGSMLGNKVGTFVVDLINQPGKTVDGLGKGVQDVAHGAEKFAHDAGHKAAEVGKSAVKALKFWER